MIFREQEFRASGVNCGRDPGGQFAANNDCAGSGASATATSSDWKQATGTKEWISSDLKKSPPIKGGDKLEALTVRDVPSFRRAQNAHGLNLDEIITLGGGPIRGAEIWAASYGGKEISVSTNIPIDPDDPDKGSVETSVTIDVDPDTNSSFIDYGTLFPDADAELDDKSRNRIASVMMERMIDSMSMAHDAGFSHAQTLAIGSKDSIDKGYRLWPQFGFDAKLPKELFDKIPKELLDKTPRVAKSSKLSRKSITLQELISTREGERWWDDNGDGIEMTLKFTDEKSLGFKRFMEMKKKLPRLKERNKSRSYLDWLDLVELRDDCGRQAGGRFGQGNNCAVDDGGANVSGGGGGTAVSDRGPKVDTDWWRSEGEAKWNSSKIKKSPPVTGGHVLNSFTVPDVGELASAMTDIGSFKSFDDVVTIGGGIRRGADIKVEGEGDMIRTKSTMPISPDGSGKDGTAEVNVTLFDNGEGFSVSYDELYVDFPEGEEDSPEAVRRVSSVLMERMTESLAKAEAIGAHTAETSAAGGATNRLKGYRLWPQFGFDGEIPKIHEDGMRELAERAIAGRGEENYDNPPAWAVKILDKLDSGEPVMMQELVASREGKNWWDENGAGINLTLDFRKKNSLGYKRYEKMKSLLSRLKDRNKNRQWVSFDDVEFRGDCTDADKAEGGRFAEGNDCGGDGGGADSVASKVKESKQRNVDVMVGGQKTVAVLDKEARDRAASDFNKNKPPDSAAGSTSDLWGRTFVERSGKSSLKITSADPVFPMDRLAQSGTYVSHESVGQFLAMRHEERRASSGGSGPGAMIDTTEPLGDDAKQYIVDALAEDAIHAYSQGRLNPGFYSSDLEDAISRMSTRHPELASDENARFVFTMITAITSNGQNPEQNIADADGLYDMYKRHGTCVPDRSVGGSRDASKSLSLFQSMIDSFGVDRTRRLLSGYTSAENVNQTLKRLSDKSGDPDWRERTGSTAWMQEHFSQPPGKAKLVKTDAGGELPDEIVPMASIFGPKIGSFFANLNGRHDFLTMDRWLMRSVGRATGELLTRSTPKQAKSRAEEALKALEDGKWSRSLLFGTDKTHGITKESLIRSLKIQAATGVIEENGAAYIWATAAERSHKNTPKPTGGQYGKHPDKRVHALHTAGNSLFKSLIHEQQDPRGAQARRNIREVFREVVKKIEEKFPDRKGKVDIDEVQAVLWQYEKNLWKHLGANTKIDENSLYSKAAEDLLSGKTKQRKFSPGSQRELLPREDEQDDGLLDTYRFEAEQEAWLGDVFESGIDFNELFLMLEESFKEQRNFAALDAVEVRSNDCGRDEGGRFGSGNKCAIASGESADGTWEVEPNIGGTTMRPDSEPAPHVLRLKGSDGEVKAFMHATVVGDSSPPKLYVDYSEVAEKHRGKGVYTNLLDSLSNQFTVVSDSPPNFGPRRLEGIQKARR